MWLANHPNIGLGVLLSESISSNQDCRIKHLMATNKIVRYAKKYQEIEIWFRKIDLRRAGILAFHDASWANMPGGKSQMGQIWFIVEMPENALLRNLEQIKGNLMGWRTARIRRIARSTFAAETLSAVDCTDRSIFIGDLLSFVLFNKPEKIGVRLVSDCCSLVQHVQFPNVISQSKILEKRLTLDLHYIKDELRTNKYIKEILWGQTTIQLADCLTKRMDPKMLHSTLESCIIKLRDLTSKKRFIHNGNNNSTEDQNDQKAGPRKKLETQIALLELMLSEEELEEFFDQVFMGETTHELGAPSSMIEITSKRKYYES